MRQLLLPRRLPLLLPTLRSEREDSAVGVGVVVSERDRGSPSVPFFPLDVGE